MNFEFVLGLLKNKTHPPPANHEAEAEAVIKILTEGQGYLTKDEPVQIVFFKDL